MLSEKKRDTSCIYSIIPILIKIIYIFNYVYTGEKKTVKNMPKF